MFQNAHKTQVVSILEQKNHSQPLIHLPTLDVLYQSFSLFISDVSSYFIDMLLG